MRGTWFAELFSAIDHVHHRRGRIVMSLAFQSSFSLIGRLLLSAIFLMAGLGKIMDWSGTVGMMEAHGMPAVQVLLPLAILVELGGGLALLVGFQTRGAAFLLFLFLIPTTLIFHHFWDLQGAERVTQMTNFLKNVAIMGGLLEYTAMGAGRFSVDAWLTRTPAWELPPKTTMTS
jgi:putative oxidoreductase